MKISKEEVEHVARLARLCLAEEEKERLRRQLDRILGYVEKLNELDMENVESVSHGVFLENILREDEVKPSLPVNEALANAPDKKGNYFKVPRIIG